MLCLQIENLEREIQEKKMQMRVLEQRILESGEASIANASLVEMQQVITFLVVVRSFSVFWLYFHVKCEILILW